MKKETFALPINDFLYYKKKKVLKGRNFMNGKSNVQPLGKFAGKRSEVGGVQFIVPSAHQLKKVQEPIGTQPTCRLQL